MVDGDLRLNEVAPKNWSRSLTGGEPLPNLWTDSGLFKLLPAPADRFQCC
jgi:hypothetical protein